MERWAADEGVWACGVSSGASACRHSPQIAVKKLVRLVEGGDADALVAAVLAVVVGIDGEGRERIGGKPRGARVLGIGGAGRHRGDYLQTRPGLRDQLIERAQHLG